MENQFQILEKILEGQYITPVYQPIVSLIDGQIYGFEALSRISAKELEMNIELMFKIADTMNKSWELETLCRKKSLEYAAHLKEGKKLFLNVNSNIIYDKNFIEGFTKSSLNAYGLDSDNVIFEITERVAINDNNAFLASINHYKGQGYGIAIDDFGVGYSGLNVIASARPDFIKLDMNLVRDIDKEEIKQLVCKAMVDFGRNAGIQVIAEGIETEEELKALIKLNVNLGQGYFLGMPKGDFQDIESEKIELIKKIRAKVYVDNIKSSAYPIVGYLSRAGHTFCSDEIAEDIYETLRHDSSIKGFTIVENDVAIGFMTKMSLNEILGGRYGFSLYSKKKIQQLIQEGLLRVNYNTPVDQVSGLAMQRPFEQLYDPIVVEKEGKYFGIVTIKDLLDACTKVEVDTAMHCNPLTGLPGNLLIEKEILSRVLGNTPYCIIYYDIDNFKAYNDAYGFQNGDMMILLVADILKEYALRDEFVGHIGGDDFIVICDYHEGEGYCKSVIDRFTLQVASLYRDEDLQNGYIVSKNRYGTIENFPIASLSIAGVSNKTKTYQSVDDFSKDIALLKKKCKRQSGNYFEIQ
ncbi:GGDEF domain-containing protein [Anaerocolumna xylanovorans]|uniref:Diguanylate cyclase (GGDEF) domain-containing protein n=1 Tax=Anaerocolumna xylanovorans DSM 12503 TaxID=1121345 RepID=A0A1M7YCZ2_9FIRM|nr:bifunctional diguanylate cyclase/phosphodiesterase [Anaerocolumna xylanovorans]SHO50504.1 diguanylate cyclase (GGDEF) domain-containing protein [Anaerocolumna xylanovorans DSM 12503]